MFIAGLRKGRGESGCAAQPDGARSASGGARAEQAEDVLFRRSARWCRCASCRGSIFEADLGQVHPLADPGPGDVARRICGSATKAAPVSPMSARQTAFHVPGDPAPRPAARPDVADDGGDHRLDHETGLGALVGTRVASTGGIATHTPAEKIFRNRGCAGVCPRSRSRAGCTGPRPPPPPPRP